jgi:hypothetical protein
MKETESNVDVFLGNLRENHLKDNPKIGEDHIIVSRLFNLENEPSLGFEDIRLA